MADDLTDLIDAPTPDLEVAPPEQILTPGKIAGLTIMKAKDVVAGFNMLDYGNPGVGKTLLAASASEVPEMCPVLHVDIEGGTLPLKKWYPNTDVARVMNFKDLQEAYNELRRGKTGYKTVIVDSLSETQKFSMYGVMKEMLTKAAEKDQDRDPDVPGMHEWMKNTEQIRLFVRAFRDLPCNTIFTSLAKHDRIGKGDPPSYVTTPGLSSKLAYEVAGFVDIVTYHYIKIVNKVPTRLLLTQATDTVTAKDRSGRLPVLLQDPTMQTIYDYMHGRIQLPTETKG